MAGNASNYAELKMLDHSLGTTAWTMPSIIRVALYTTNPTDADTGTEVDAGGYARQAATFAAASDGTTSNDAVITFGPATADWGTVTHLGIRDAASAGNLIYYGPLSSSVTVTTNQSVQFSVGQLVISLD